MYYLDEYMEQEITLYDNKASEVTAKKISMENMMSRNPIQSRRNCMRGSGLEPPAEYEGDYIDIGSLPQMIKTSKEKDRVNPLYTAKSIRSKPGESSLTIRVKGRTRPKPGIEFR